MRARRPLLTSAVTALLVAGCGGPATSDTASGPPAATPTASGTSEQVDQQAPPAGLVIEVDIAGGDVTPTNAALQAAVGEPIVIRVDSDVADRLHIHSVPEHTFAVVPRAGQSFEFGVDVPGRVDVELHALDRTVATIQVR